MEREFLDIVPHSNGWCFVGRGLRSPAYPSYHLALAAAKKLRTERKSDTPPVLRHLDLKGRLLPIDDRLVFPEPRFGG